MHNLANLFLLTVTLFLTTVLRLDCASPQPQPFLEAVGFHRSGLAAAGSQGRFSRFPCCRSHTLTLAWEALGFCCQRVTRRAVGDRNPLWPAGHGEPGGTGLVASG